MKTIQLTVAAVITIAVVVAVGLWVFNQPSSSTPNTHVVETPGLSPARPALSAGRTSRSQYWDKPLSLPPGIDEIAGDVPEPVKQWLIAWKVGEIAGKSATETEIAELRQLLESHDVAAARMAQIVAVIAALDGDSTVLPLCETVLSRASDELKHFEAPAPSAKPTVDALWLLHPVLWDSKSYGQDEKLLVMLRPWEVRGSGHSQWVMYIYAEALMLQGKHSAAYDAFRSVLSERATAYEPSDGLNRSLDWEFGLCLYNAGRYAEAAPHLSAVSRARQGNDSRTSLMLLIRTLALLGRVTEAQEAQAAFDAQYVVSRSEALENRLAIELAAVRASSE